MLDTKKPAFLMCPPDYFMYPETYRKINNHMHRMREANPRRAKDEWQNFAAVLMSLGAEIHILPPAEGLPDMVFTRNGALPLPPRDGKSVILSAFKNEERQPESMHHDLWFKEHGYEVHRLQSKHLVFEGGGEAIFLDNNTLFVGSGSTRMTFNTVPFLTALLYGKKIEGISVVSLRLATDDFYHLDTCFMPIPRPEGEKHLLVYYPPAFERHDVKLIEQFPGCIPVPVSEHDAYAFGCNFIALGNHVVMPGGTKDLVRTLCSYGLVVIEVDVSEFIECGGGGPFCLTLGL